VNLPVTIRDAHPLYAYGIDLAATSASLALRATLAFAEFDYLRGAKAIKASETIGSKATVVLKLANAVRR
jgi:hypothetical protein